jgi:hypothetical protein
LIESLTYTNVKHNLSLHAINTCFSDGQSSHITEQAEVGKSLIGIISSETLRIIKYNVHLLIIYFITLTIGHTGVYK